MKNLSNSIFSPSSCRYWSRIYAWFAWFGLNSHVLPRCFSMQLSPTTWVSQLQREVQNIGFLKLCFFRCASISWFQAVSGSVIYRFQLAHLRVFQIIIAENILKKVLIIKYLYYLLAYSIKSAEESFSLSLTPFTPEPSKNWRIMEILMVSASRVCP